MVNINDFMQEKTCMYKGEIYSVRDNGAIMRHCRDGMRMRKLDEMWTFGNPNVHTGYMEFGGERVHRIVATAFHGKAPSDQHVVDHIDTNRRNNRPNNLRWVTKLENILLNEITRKKIELRCGSVEAFLNNPTLLNGYENDDKNFIWMKNVTPEEAKNCLDNLKRWAKTASPDPNYRKRKQYAIDRIYDKPVNSDLFRNMRRVAQSPKNFEIENTIIESVSSDVIKFEKVDTKEWLEKVYGENREINVDSNKNVIAKEEPLITQSLTPNAVQIDWKHPVFFPCCPQQFSGNPLEAYMANLKEGAIFSTNNFGESTVLRFGMPQSDCLWVMCSIRIGWKTHAFTKITFKDGIFNHENMGVYDFGDDPEEEFDSIINP